MKRTAFFILLATLCSCATMSGRLSPEDAAWDESVMPMQWETVFKNIIGGFQICNSGIPKCHVFRDTRHAECDIYRIELGGGAASARIIGFVEVRALNDKSSSLRLGIHKDLATESAFKRWRDYAAGIYDCRGKKGK